ncbi:MAG TPA: transglycosylase SLT domain-containing protein [Burkholderiales bacterium]|jgi:soluble lytic murein transglycosylase-like protein|nr:transglycosylase SLT domain-containing protein [Burkholderiales bacterium]
MQAIANLSRMFSLVRSLLALIGLAAVVAVVLPVPHETILQHISAAARADDSVSIVTATGPIQGAAATPHEREQRAVTEFIARRYRVSEAAAAGFVATAYQAGREFSLDPMLILAVMAIESRYNPVAESSMGAKGLMQVIPKYHPEKLADHGGELALLDPEVNILVGTRILREYLRRLGEIEAALQMYAGALDEPTSQYSGKVLAEKARLQQVRLRARNEVGT